MQLLTILGACIVDEVFLTELIANPAVAAYRYGFVLTRKELDDLNRLIAHPTEDRGNLLTDLHQLFGSRGCPVWPCPDYELTPFVNAGSTSHSV